jgi:hypothetical protein
VPWEQRSRFPQQGRRTLTCHLWGFLLIAKYSFATPSSLSHRHLEPHHQRLGPSEAWTTEEPADCPCGFRGHHHLRSGVRGHISDLI